MFRGGFKRGITKAFANDLRGKFYSNPKKKEPPIKRAGQGADSSSFSDLGIGGKIIVGIVGVSFCVGLVAITYEIGIIPTVVIFIFLLLLQK